MKKFWTAFFKRGLMICGLGPVVLAIIYGILGAAGVIETLTPAQVSKGILTITLMAFIAAGVTAVYQIDRLPIAAALLIHGFALYLDYLMIYLVNGWIAEGITPLLIFTAIFAVGYGLIWLIIYTVTKKTTRKLNRHLAGGTQ